MKRARTQQKIQHQSELYRIVFSSVYVKLAVLFMFGLLLLQPVAPVFASEEPSEASSETASAPVEEVTAPEPVVEEVVVEDAEPESESEVSPVDEEVIEEETNVDDVASSGPAVEDVTEGDPEPERDVIVEEQGEDVLEERASTTTDVEEKATTTTPASQGDTSAMDSGSGAGGGDVTESDTSSSTDETVAPDDSVASSTEPVASSTEEVLEDTTEVVETPVDETAEPEPTTDSTTDTADTRSDDSLNTNESETQPATTTEQAGEEVTSAYVINNDNRYQFSESQCVSVGDGSFYCSTEIAGTNSQDDGVHARVTEAGDKEIFYMKNGIETQITDNALEDEAPYLDATTDTIVFHRLVDGRYQIFEYDLSSGAEAQLTDSRENNMEPTKQGDVVVWQQWGDENWEIMARIDGKIKRLTNNQYHDVAPTIRDGYIMWHTTNADGEKLLSVYEVETGVSSVVADPDGGHVENPRFVLVYDTVFENGDTVTKEYDPETGEIRPIGSDPAPMPVNIPEPEPTDETRALIQNKSTSAKDELVSSDGEGGNTGLGLISGVTASSSVETGAAENETTDLDLSASTTAPLPLSEFDIIIEPFASTSSAQQVDSTSATSSVE